MTEPMPVKGKTNVFPLVHKDLEERRAKGIATYGTELQTENGRNSLQDALEEAYDLSVYLRQVIEEIKALRLIFKKSGWFMLSNTWRMNNVRVIHSEVNEDNPTEMIVTITISMEDCE